MKIVRVILKVLFSLILLLPVLGVLGIFPAPTRDLYNTDIAFQFIQILAQLQYVDIMMAIVNVIAVIALWTRREALAAALVAPITANVIGFHVFADGGLFTAGAIPAIVMVLLNVYFLWIYRNAYRGMLQKRA